MKPARTALSPAASGEIAEPPVSEAELRAVSIAGRDAEAYPARVLYDVLDAAVAGVEASIGASLVPRAVVDYFPVWGDRKLELSQVVPGMEPWTAARYGSLRVYAVGDDGAETDVVGWRLSTGGAFPAVLLNGLSLPSIGSWEPNPVRASYQYRPGDLPPKLREAVVSAFRLAFEARSAGMPLQAASMDAVLGDLLANHRATLL